jgi:tetratricopeptide (TPR) repeat protein
MTLDQASIWGRTATLLGLMLSFIQTAVAADTKCADNPSVACVAEIAAQNARSLERSSRWESILLNLAVAGRIGDAEQLAHKLPNGKAWLEQEITALRIAAAAKANPSNAASLDALSTLGDVNRISQALNLLVLDLAHEQPYTRGGEPWLVDAEKAYATNHRVACNSTLKSALQRWSEIVESVHAASRVSAHIDLADAYSNCGDSRSAMRILNRIDPNELARANESLHLTLLVRGWIRAGSIDRALVVATLQPDAKDEVQSYIEVATAYAIEGRNIDALNVISKAFEASANVKGLPRVVELQARLIDVERRADGLYRATKHTEELASLAERPDPFQPFNMIRVATLFNDLNLPDRALQMLEKTLSTIPPSDRIVAFGFVFGPIRYDKSGLGGDVLQDAAIQLYRAGNRAKAVELIRQIDPLHKRRAAREIVRDQPTKKPQVDPEAIAEALQSENGAELLLVAAARKIEYRDLQSATDFFQRFTKTSLPQEPLAKAQLDLQSVRLAVLLGKPKYVTFALQQGLRHADGINDSDLRTAHLSSLAALANVDLP